MMWIVENPWPVVIVGICIQLALVVALFRTGRVKMVLWMAIVAAVVGVYWLVEEFIVTDREQIATNLYAIADAMERRDVATVEKYISKSAPRTLSRAQQAAGMRFVEVRVNDDLTIDVRGDVDPPQAKATGTVTVVMASGYSTAMPVQVSVMLRKVDGEWLIYSHEEPRGGIR